MPQQSLTALARDTAVKFFDAVEAGDIDAAVELLDPEVRVWHNIDGKVVDRQSTSKTLTFLHKALADVRYEDRRLNVWPGGFSEQHVLVGKRRSDDVTLRLSAAIICSVNERGRIDRFDEYFDSKGQAEISKGYKRQQKL